MSASRIEVRLLGPVDVLRDGVALDLGGPQPRAVVAHLALDVGRVVPVDRLIDRLWGDDPPRTPLGTLQSYVSRLRRVIEPERAAGSPPVVLVSEAPGYVLRLDPENVDVHRFRRSAIEARAARSRDDPEAALERFDEALALWRGDALAGVGPEDEIRPIVVALDEERWIVHEDRFESLLALGRHGLAVPDLQRAVEERPLREGLWALLATALYRSNRQADALRALTSAREHLLDELGLDPGPVLRTLESRILDHDPALLAAPRPQPVEATSGAPSLGRRELVGRAREQRTLVDAIERAGAGSPGAVLVEGEPGAGKSTLVDAAVAFAAARGWGVALGRCVDADLAPSLWPAIEIVRSVVDQLDDELEPDHPLRPYVAGAEIGRPLSPVELVEHFLALLDRAGDRPWCFAVDDLHWADRATLDVITLFLARLGRRRVVLLAAHRPIALVPDAPFAERLAAFTRAGVTTRITLSPLEPDDVARLMELTTGTAPDEPTARVVHERAGGNPLFVTELARLGGERGVRADAVPDAIRDVVRDRLAQLPAATTAELQVAAVLGERFDLRLAMAASEREPDDCLDALDPAVATRILVPEAAGFRFAHALVRDAVLAEISDLRLARLHQRAAEALVERWGDGPDAAEPVARHRWRAALVGDPVTTARALNRASDVARWRNALDVADELAEGAVDLLAGVPRTDAAVLAEVEALEALLASAQRRTDPDAVEQRRTAVAERADRIGTDPARALALFIRWGDIDEAGDLADQGADSARATEMFEAANDPYTVTISGYMAGSYALLTGDLVTAERYLEASVGAVPVRGLDERPDHVPMVLGPIVAGFVAAMRGRDGDARDHVWRRGPAWLSQRSEVEPSVRAALAFTQAFVEALLDEPAGVLRAFEHVAPDDEHGFLVGQADASATLLGWARARLGDPAALDDAVAAMTAVDDGPELVLRSALRTLVAGVLAQHDDPRAVDWLRLAEDEARARGETWYLAETLRLRATLLDDPDERRVALDAADELARRQGAELVASRIEASRRDLASA